MPVEHWHVRHLKGSGLADGAEGCRRANAVSAVLATDGVRRKVTVEPMEERFPRAWAEEYAAALENLTRTVDRLGH